METIFSEFPRQLFLYLLLPRGCNYCNLVKIYQQQHYSKARLRYWYIPQQEYSLQAAPLYQFGTLQVFYLTIFCNPLPPQWCHIEQHLRIYLYRLHEPVFATLTLQYQCMLAQPHQLVITFLFKTGQSYFAKFLCLDTRVSSFLYCLYDCNYLQLMQLHKYLTDCWMTEDSQS